LQKAGFYPNLVFPDLNNNRFSNKFFVIQYSLNATLLTVTVFARTVFGDIFIKSRSCRVNFHLTSWTMRLKTIFVFHRHVRKASSKMLKARPHVQRKLLIFHERQATDAMQSASKALRSTDRPGSAVRRQTLGSTSSLLKGGMLQVTVREVN
jgi:hypothetical protein